ncbi:MAG: DEAD/DEAH box helicase, partial [Planctomycetes bacterium]|nr:DEAD/DEAH box helicase [Planctomycetota bacterium]
MSGASPFVIHRDLGIGRLDLDRGVLWFFDSPALPEVEIPAEQELFQVTRLEVQQRIWWFDGIRWVTGRISAHDDEAGTAYLVAFPNGVMERRTAESIRVRWNRPISDVLGMLKGRVAETRFFHDARSGFQGRFSAQRAACQGLAGVLSSAVELHTHQVAAARRVLQDPVPRYLLADEVGLGKTIEAGMIARQLMIEAPGEVLVAVPPHLVSQWQRELSSKFRLDSVGGRVQVVAFGEASNVPEIHRRLVIVDEAHRLVSSL